MKFLVLSTLLLSLTALTACQTSAETPAADTRTIELTGTQARTTVEIPSSTVASNTEAPYALQGSPSGSATTPPTTGYQAR